MSFRKLGYRTLARSLFGLCAPFCDGAMACKGLKDLDRTLKSTGKLADDGRIRIWFHAASVGELESLWTLIAEFSKLTHCELILTIFSQSAASSLKRLQDELPKSVSLLYCGYAPIEGQWQAAIQRLEPSVFVTAKYEAWPDLWMTLADAGIPLVIVGAKLRSALLWGKKICRSLGAPLPKMSLCVTGDADVRELKSEFSDAEVLVLGEPRWDRAKARALKGNDRARNLVVCAQAFPRPWGVMGSAWIADLNIWKSAWPDHGSLWIVPHRVDKTSIEEITTFLTNEGFDVFHSSIGIQKVARKSASANKKSVQVIVVDEMGFLLELYASADWAYVGGGFGQGLHSTIEPALYGIPVAGGTARAERFPEVSELVSTGQLTLIRNESDLLIWTKGVDAAVQKNRKRWLAEVQSRLGSTGQLLQHLLDVAQRAC